MFHLLIVDDEPYIVDSLFDLFRGSGDCDLNIYKAYSGTEALEILNETKIDIVMTDIRMPGMTGLELLDQIRLYWPYCKVIFLTGYNDFDFIYKAIHEDGVNYLLKTERSEVILKSVEKAIVEIKNKIANDRFIHKAKQQMHLALPLLQNEYILDLLEGKASSLEEVRKQFTELDIPLDPRFGIIILIGRVDIWPGNPSSAEKTQHMYSIGSIMEQFLSSVVVKTVIYDHSRILCLIQPKGLNDAILLGGIAAKNTWERFFKSVIGSLETVQNVCSELLKISISFALSREPSSWENIKSRFDSLKILLNRGLGMEREMLLIDSGTPKYVNNESKSNATALQKMRLCLSNLDLLESYLESGQKRSFDKLYFDIMDSIKENVISYNSFAIEAYQSIALRFLSFLNKYGLIDELPKEIDLRKLIHMEEHSSWDEISDFFFTLSNVVFDIKRNDQEKRTTEMIAHIQWYIKNYMDKDISLIKLADEVNLNPSYLSRLYKQITGVNLSDYIDEARIARAKELLKSTNLKVHEIAVAIGYSDSSYFVRFFKKQTNVTPQEYRVSCNPNSI